MKSIRKNVSKTPADVSRRSFLKTSSVLAAAMVAGFGVSAGTSERRNIDVVIYGGTSGGVIAAATLARLGRSVLLVEPTRHLGGMTTGGLGYVDFGRAETIGGLTKKYYDDIRAYYTTANVKSNGWCAEPHVAEMFLERMLAEHKVEVLREARLGAVTMIGRRIHSITLDKAPVDLRGAPAALPQEAGFLTATASVFIDCSYEGDLMARAGVSYRHDRESKDEYGESLAGFCSEPIRVGWANRDKKSKQKGKLVCKIDPYVRQGDSSSGLIPLIANSPSANAGSQNSITQAYNFRLCLTKDCPIAITAPSNYDPKDFELVYRFIDALQDAGEPLWRGDLYYNFDRKSRYDDELPRLLKITNLMFGKTDVNTGGPISIDFVTGGAEHYAEGTWAERARLWHAHEDYERGFLYFLRTDERLPDWLRKEIALWGLARDEFRDTGGWPTQLYVREARRMVSHLVIDQNHCENPNKREDSIGLGSYALDSHNCQRLVRDGMVVNEGAFFSGVKPYAIPYGALVPREDECENLFVTSCLSSTHVAFASIRMEPPFMILGESAGLAADLVLKEGTSAQNINIKKLRTRLLDAGQIV